MTGEGITKTPQDLTTPASYSIILSTSLTNRIYGIFQIQDGTVIEEIAESDYLV
ncbi:hypothetical protein KSK55_03845 [Methanospirillum purgamenti]|jgi:hypothetical protein|uniref:Uncharacterized protein n=1 Tax=Methanospirillum hungatei TaxID=2203 RepID=A0A8F5VPK5_METHU|nr:hypothetical protein [Methanospirillum hungatei]QXO95543.1 hypothetical protein KSK55_03845 [Methanospirillum hungatei]